MRGNKAQYWKRSQDLEKAKSSHVCFVMHTRFLCSGYYMSYLFIFTCCEKNYFKKLMLTSPSLKDANLSFPVVFSLFLMEISFPPSPIACFFPVVFFLFSFKVFFFPMHAVSRDLFLFSF